MSNEGGDDMLSIMINLENKEKNFINPSLNASKSGSTTSQR